MIRSYLLFVKTNKSDYLGIGRLFYQVWPLNAVHIIVKAHMKNICLMTPDDVAALLKVNAGTLANWRVKGIGPRWTRVGAKDRGKIRYRHEDVQAYIAQNLRAEQVSA